jgi:hypothetical protein
MPSPNDRKMRPNPLPAIPAEAALSFLKDTKGALEWTTRDLADTLHIDRREAEQALAFLQAQGYVQPARSGAPVRKAANARGQQQWMTTPAGEAVSGAKPPRFTRESVEQALAALKDRIQANKKERQAPFRIADAVAFGDFLLPDRPRVQSADVGINLVRSESRSPSRSGQLKMDKSTSHSLSAPRSEPRSATEAKAERSFLRDLRAKSAHLTLRPYAGWMRQRTHQDLL